jgi:hypothetical protein
MSEWIIKHSDGSPLKDANGNDVTTKTLEYSGSWMGECFVTITFNSPVPISFKIGDYLTYRGEIFEINYDPGKIKQSRRNEHGEAFVYNNVKFNAKQDELVRTEFLDIVLHDNNIHYTSLTKFSFYASSLDDLLDRIQANLNEQWGDGEWKIYSRNKLRSGQRGCIDAVWDKTYGSGVSDNTIKSTSITADGLNCWSALALVNSQFNVNFIVRGRNVFVGTAGLPTSMIFEYGKGRGLYQIEQNADSEQAITTRLRAYGSSKNLPNRYYATLNLQAFATVSSIEAKGSSDGNYNIQAYLDLPFSIAYFYNQLHELSDGRPSYLVTIECGGFKVKASVFKAKNSEKTCFFAAHNNTLNLASHQNDLTDIQNFGNAVEVGQRITFLSGVKKESFPRDNKTYATDNLPNNMAIDHLMLPGFPNKSLKQWWDEQPNDVKNRIYSGEKSHLFSENKYRPYVDSTNISEIGVRPNSVYFDTENIQEGLVEIFPTIEEMEIGGVRIDEVHSADKIEDNGVFKDGASIPNFHIYLKSAIDFDINDLIGNSTETPTISMKDGMCGGRTFQINSAKKLGDGRWELNCQRVKDESLNLYFPYNDYLIKEGDHFVLLGIPLPDSYVETASRKLLKYALEYLDKNDYTRYIYAPKIDDVFMARQHDKAITDTTGTIVSLHDTIKEGDIMQFDDNDLNINGKIAIDQLTIRENEDKIPSYEITLREDKSVGTIQKIQEKINSLWSGNGGGSGIGGNNLTVPQIQRLIESYGGQNFLNKLKPDTAQEVITFLKGIEFGDDFVKDGSGAGVYKDDNGQWHIDTDYLHARKKLTAEEVEIMKTSHIKGKVVNSAGGFVISRIEKITDAWRCYFVQQDSEGRRVYNSMRVDDLALCETFNLVNANGQLSNHYWHRRVVDVGTDYVDIADNTNVDDYASGSDTPQVGDEVVQLGNITVKERQSAIIQSAAGEFSPYFKIIKGINSFTLPPPIFLFDKQKFEIRVENPAKRGEYIPLQDSLDSMQGRINSVQQQADKQLVIWFGDAVPTLTTEPANEWADDTTKELHEHDIYYNRSYAQTGGGRAYSFEKNPDNTYSWHEITDADVLKSLEAAKHAQDTADGKRRVFVRDVPTPPYDAGDQWANAIFPDKYNNDLLVCVRPKATGEPFDIEDWQSAQHYTTKQFEAEFNVGGKSISAVVNDLRTGLETVGMHLDGENSTFDIVADRFKVRTTTGKVPFFTDGEKLNADFIDAKKIVTKGLQAGDIDANNATIKNLKVEGNSVFKGRLEGTNGSFTDLTCVDDKGQVVAGLHFSPDGKMVFDGDISSQGSKTINGRSRSLRYYASDIWCRGQFGHYSRICAVIKDNMMFVHHSGHEYTNGVKIKLASTRTRDGREVYLIPLYSPGLPSAKRNGEEVVDYDNPKIYELYSNSYGRKIAEELELPAGASIDVVVFNCTSYHLYNFVGMGYGKQWTVINGNDNVEAWICCHGSDFKVNGGWNLNCCYINPDWLTPSTVDRNSLGAGVMVGKELDMNW